MSKCYEKGLSESMFEFVAKREIDKVSDLIFLQFGFTSSEVTNAFKKYKMLNDSQTGGGPSF